MALANASFKIDITEKGSGPLVLASHPPASAQSGKIESHRDSYRQRLFQQPARPVPSPGGLVVKNGLKIFSFTSDGMPPPLSRILISTLLPRLLVASTSVGS